MQIAIEYFCTACDWTWGPIIPRPVSPGALEYHCYVYCDACGTPASVFGPPTALPFRCSCGSQKYRPLSDCPKCHAKISQRTLPPAGMVAPKPARPPAPAPPPVPATPASAIGVISSAQAMALALCFANNPNGVSDVIVTYSDGTTSSGWYASRTRLGEGMPLITLTHRPERPNPRPDMILELARVAHVKVELSNGVDQEFGEKPADPAADFARLTKLTGELHAAGQYGKAVDTSKECCDLVRDKLGEGHRLMAAALANYGELLRIAGRHAEAEGPLTRAAEGARRHYPANDPDRARAIVSLATYYFDLQNYAKAEPLFRESLDLRHAIAPNSLEVAESLNSLGLVQIELGNFAHAEPLVRHALEIYRAHGAEKTRGNARAIHNLAMVLGRSGNYAASGPLFHQALELRRAMYGDEHPDTVESMSSFGTFYFVQGDLARARPLYEQALAITRKVLGEDHPQTATRCMDLALCFKHMQSMQSAQAAEPLLRQAFDIRRAKLGEAHPSTLSSRQELAGVRRALGLS